MANKTPAKLGDQDFKIVSFIEQRFWETGGVPTPDYTAEFLSLPLKAVTDFWKKPSAREALLARGIDLNPARSAQLLTPVQLMLANMLLNAHDKRSVREKLQQLNISSQQYHAWLRDAAFSDYLRKRAEELFKASDFQAYMTLMGAIENGDVNATMKFFEMRNIYNPKLQIDVNIEQVIVRVVEVVAKHVQEPAILEAIATDLEQLDLGNRGAISANSF